MTFKTGDRIQYPGQLKEEIRKTVSAYDVHLIKVSRHGGITVILLDGPVDKDRNEKMESRIKNVVSWNPNLTEIYYRD